MSASRYTFFTLIVIVAIAGMSQGLTLPLLAILLEQQGVSSVANGINAAALYIGIMLVTPWLEIPLRRIGYRHTIVAGLILITIATVLLPLFNHLAIWFLLRMLLGAGDSALHYSSQMWVTALASPETRGRDISLYGLAFGVGFSVGPLGLNLLPFGLWAPFAALAATYAVAFLMVARLKNEFPDMPQQKAGESKNKYALVIGLAWWALIPSFIYGYLEASLNGSFPVYALRIGVSVESVSVILASFVIGSILLQMPIGSLSDRIGRKKVMAACAFIGAVAFLLFPLAGQSVWLMMTILAIAGAAVGSFYSLGLAYSADILPASLVPTAGIIASLNYSIASIAGPTANGYVFEYLEPWMMFGLIGGLLGFFTILGFFFREGAAREKREEHTMPV
ncbi:MFS transporter [Brevibacillus migulae]|uniref:MFS transporter n=1 Tax=Brevibacillus migulae TaxID=1644114 RepID=UPI00106E6EC1|nr:MFS transporter [Brevibacillus migulae]